MSSTQTLRASKSILALLATLSSSPGALMAQVYDEVTTKNDSHILGEIIHMIDGKLKVKSAFAGELDGDVDINWSEVKSLTTAKPLPFVLNDGTTLMGLARSGGDGRLEIRSNDLQPNPVLLTSIAAINPPEVKAITYKGNFGLGASASDGNTRNKAFNLLGEFEARSERQRLTLRGGYNYAEDQDSVTQQLGKAGIKYDFFITKRFYIYAAALFEHDGLQDLSLRTALSAGPGYQFIDKGDFTAEWLAEMQLLGEVGVSYFNENYKVAPDQEYVAARWSVKFDWPFLPKRVTFFHFHEGYPSLERASDLYITTETGLRFTIWNNFVAALQVNWRWDNTPSPGFGRSDTLYLASLGYSFEF